MGIILSYIDLEISILKLLGSFSGLKKNLSGWMVLYYRYLKTMVIHPTNFFVFYCLEDWSVYKNHIMAVKSKDKVIFSNNWKVYIYLFLFIQY